MCAWTHSHAPWVYRRTAVGVRVEADDGDAAFGGLLDLIGHLADEVKQIAHRDETRVVGIGCHNPVVDLGLPLLDFTVTIRIRVQRGDADATHLGFRDLTAERCHHLEQLYARDVPIVVRVRFHQTVIDFLLPRVDLPITIELRKQGMT